MKNYMRHRQGTEAEQPSSAADPDQKTPLDIVRRSKAIKVLIVTVVIGVLLIATIGFAGSYSAVREVAREQGFGNFSKVFPLGIDAGIVVLLALDLLLTWLRMPFPLLRQTAWLLTAATIAFNAASAWPKPLGTAMHAVIPVLFIVTVEAARHAIGRTAQITANKHMESVRLWRWFLAPGPTFRLWRRMKLWELRSYEEVIALEQDRLVYQARLHARYGRGWRRRAPVEALLPLKLARYGLPLGEEIKIVRVTSVGRSTLDQQRTGGEAEVDAQPAVEPGPIPEPEAPVQVTTGAAAESSETGSFPRSTQQLEVHLRAREAADTGRPLPESSPVPRPREASWEIRSEAHAHLVPTAEPAEETHPTVVEETHSGVAKEVGAPVSAKTPARPRVDARVSAWTQDSAGAGRSDTLEQVKALLRGLSLEERDQSNRALAERLAPQLGLSADRVRKHYLKPARSAIAEEEAGPMPPQ